MSPGRAGTPSGPDAVIAGLTQRWILPGIGGIRVVQATARMLQAIDADWPARRRPQHLHHHWKWTEIARRARETLAVVDDTSTALALWSSRKRRVHVEGGPWYRLDYLEVDARFHKTVLAPHTVSLACVRALALGSSGLLLPCLDQTAERFFAIGAEWGLPRGWNCPAGLVPFTLCRDSAKKLEEAARGYEEATSA